jgi:hypothetical protein
MLGLPLLVVIYLQLSGCCIEDVLKFSSILFSHLSLSFLGFGWFVGCVQISFLLLW